MVDDTEAEVRRLLDYCGLPFEPQCLRFYENDRPVRTASSEQVRRPIYRDGVDQWRSFEPWLGPAEGGAGPSPRVVSRITAVLSHRSSKFVTTPLGRKSDANAQEPHHDIARWPGCR
jgi:hypothetical protein